MFICQFFLLFLRANLSGIQEYRKDVVVSVVDKSLMILFVSVLLWTDLVPSGFSIYNFIYAQILAYFLAVFVVVVLLLKSKSPILKVNTVLLRGILNEIWPYALLGFLMLFYFKIDAVMIERMLPDGDLQAGFYAQAYKLLEACVMFAVLFSTLLFPMFSNLLKREKKVNDLVSSSLGLLLIPSVLLCIISCFYSSEIIEFLFDSNSIETVTTFPVLMFVLVPLAGSYIYGTLITAQGDLKLLNSISFIALLLNVIGNYYAINHYGIAGAAAVTLVTQFFVFGVQFLVSRKRFGLETDSKLILKASILVILTAISAYFSKDFQAHWLLKFIVLLVGFTLLAVAAKLIRLNSLKTISEGSLAE